jgi:hypothetical protein
VPDIGGGVEADEVRPEQALEDSLPLGRMRKVSEEWKGMWRKKPMRASGMLERTSAGTRIRW